MERKDIEDKYKWDLGRIYKNKKSLKAAEKKVLDLTEELKKYKGKVTDSSKNLFSVLELDNELNQEIENIQKFSYLDYDTDTKVNSKIKLKGEHANLVSKLTEELSFVGIEIKNSDHKVIKKYIKKEKGLELYESYLEDVFRYDSHKLTREQDELIAAMNDTFGAASSTYSILSNTSLKFEDIEVDGKKKELNSSTYLEYLKSLDVNVRKQAFENFYKVYDQFKDTFANTYKYKVKSAVVGAKVHKYKSSLHASLFANKIDPKIYDNLIEAVNDKIDVVHKYTKLKKDALKFKEMHMYDFYLSLTGEADTKYTFEEAKDLVLKGLEPLGEEYISKLTQLFEEDRIDVLPNDSKTSGAYMMPNYGSGPFVLLNFKNDLNSVSTVAHELGHAMHNVYQNESNPYLYASHPIFTAEIASIVNETILSNYLLEKTDDKNLKKEILSELIDGTKGTLFRQTMFAEYEKTIHESEANGEVLTADFLSETYYKLNKKYYGKSLVHDDLIKYEWARISHFYRSFYVYQYATGQCIAMYIANKILEGDEEFRDKYIEFLKKGDDKFPTDIVSELGIDLTSKEYIYKAIEIFEGYIEDFKKLNN